MLKMVLLSAVGNTKVGEQPVVKVEDVNFAYAMVKYYYENITEFVKNNLYSSQREMKLNKVLNLIRGTDEDGLSSADFAKKCSFLNTNERMDIIKDLKEANRICITQGETGGYVFHYLN